MYVQHLHQGLSIGKTICNKGGGDPVGDFVKNTVSSVTDAVDNTFSSAADIVNPALDSIGLKGVREGLTDTWHQVSPIVDTVAKFTPAAPFAYAYDAYDAARRYGDTGEFGDLASAGINAGLAGYGMPFTEQTGFMNGDPIGDAQAGLSSVFQSSPDATGSMTIEPDMQQTMTVGGTNSTGDYYDQSTNQSLADIMSGPQNKVDFTQDAVGNMTGEVNQPQMSSPHYGGIFSDATSQAPAPVTDLSTSNTGQVTGMGGAPVNTGKDWTNYTMDGLKGQTGMDWGTLSKARALGNLWGAYNAQQRQGQLSDMFNQQKGLYDTQMTHYNDYTKQMDKLSSDPTSYYNSPEYQAINANLAATLARRDAAAGRRSQYGARANQLNAQFMQNLQGKLGSLSTLRGAVPNASGMNAAYLNKAANESAIGQNIAGAAANYFAPSLMSLF